MTELEVSEVVLHEKGNPSSAGPLEVKLRVYDEGLQTEKEFFCETKLLLAHMSYFKKYLTESDDTDILIHCDIYVFSWLMKYVKARELEDLPVLNDENCLPVLIASNFLEMCTLVGECIAYIAENFRKLLQMPTDLNFLTQELIKQLAGGISVVTLEEIWQELESTERHPKSSKSSEEVKSLGVKSLLDKLYEHKLSHFIETNKSIFSACSVCGKIYCKSFSDNLYCSKATMKMSLNGHVDTRHREKSSWDIQKFLSGVQEAYHHRHLYWFFWSKAKELKCTVCHEAFMASDMMKCAYHPKKALYPPAELCGYYLCCKKDASKFNSLESATPRMGCKECEHQVDLEGIEDHQRQKLALFRNKLSQMLPMFSELDNLGSDAEASDAGNKPESVVDSNIGFYFNFMRNQPQTKSKTSSEVKLRLLGQNYQEASWQTNETADRSQKGRRSVLYDALHNLDCHRMQDLMSKLSKQRKA